MKKTFLILFLFCSVLATGQVYMVKGKNGLYSLHPMPIPDTAILKSCHSNNYELYYDSSSKRTIRIELDHIEFMEWVNQYWKKKGEVWIMNYKNRESGSIGIGTSKPEQLTSKQLWLYWYKEVNACWWDGTDELTDVLDDAILRCENLLNQYQPGSKEYNSFSIVLSKLRVTLNELIKK